MLITSNPDAEKKEILFSQALNISSPAPFTEFMVEINRPPIFCDQCPKLALAKLDGAPLCSTCLIRKIDGAPQLIEKIEPFLIEGFGRGSAHNELDSEIPASF